MHQKKGEIRFFFPTRLEEGGRSLAKTQKMWENGGATQKLRCRILKKEKTTTKVSQNKSVCDTVTKKIK